MKFLFLILLVIFAFSLIPSCGIKGPPRPPERFLLPDINDLSYRIEKDRITLSWSARIKGEGLKETVGFVVYRAVSGLEGGTFCRNCPKDFKALGEIQIPEKDKTLPDVIHPTFTDKIERGHRYAYKVQPYSENLKGTASNIVEFTY